MEREKVRINIPSPNGSKAFDLLRAEIDKLCVPAERASLRCDVSNTFASGIKRGLHMAYEVILHDGSARSHHVAKVEFNIDGSASIYEATAAGRSISGWRQGFEFLCRKVQDRQHAYDVVIEPIA